MPNIDRFAVQVKLRSGGVDIQHHVISKSAAKMIQAVIDKALQNLHDMD